jgi:tRNA G18 (ribose-2'-O)-methylase SpoU
MLGRGDSINAAVAVGVLLYELSHQRCPNPGYTTREIQH